MTTSTDFGQFISEQRKRLKIQGRELARILGISPEYLCQIERGKRVRPSVRLLKKMIDTFDLNYEETVLFYDMYAEASGELSPDIVEYVEANDIIKKALRTAQALKATDRDWEIFIDSLNK